MLWEVVSRFFASRDPSSTRVGEDCSLDAFQTSLFSVRGAAASKAPLHAALSRSTCAANPAATVAMRATTHTTITDRVGTGVSFGT